MEVGYRVGCVLATLSFPLFLLLWPRCHHSMRSALERESVGDLTAEQCWLLTAALLHWVLETWLLTAAQIAQLLLSWFCKAGAPTVILGHCVHVKITKWSKCHCFLDNPVVLRSPQFPQIFLTIYLIIRGIPKEMIGCQNGAGSCATPLPRLLFSCYRGRGVAWSRDPERDGPLEPTTAPGRLTCILQYSSLLTPNILVSYPTNPYPGFQGPLFWDHQWECHH